MTLRILPGVRSSGNPSKGWFRNAVAEVAGLGQAILMRPMLLGLTIAGMTTSCDLWTSTARGISIRLDANPLVAQAGDTVNFTVIVSATAVSGVVIDFGDSSGDQSSTGGLPTALVNFQHAYATTGNYMSRATVSDAAVGDRVVTQQIVVIPKSDSTQTVGHRAVSRRPSP